MHALPFNLRAQGIEKPHHRVFGSAVARSKWRAYLACNAGRNREMPGSAFQHMGQHRFGQRNLTHHVDIHQFLVDRHIRVHTQRTL